MHTPFFKSCYRDDNAFRPSGTYGGWRETCLSPTGIYWGPFRARRNR